MLLFTESGSAKGMIGWLVAVVLIGLIFWVIKTLVPMEGKFALVGVAGVRRHSDALVR